MSDPSFKAIKLKKVSQVRVFENAVEQIRVLILDGTIVPGQKLPTEQELCRQLNVSRSSIREALRCLEAEGLVDVRRGSGTFISDRSTSRRLESELTRWIVQREETLEQVLEVREHIEGLTASLAASRATQEEIAEIRKIHDEQVKKVSQSDGEEERTNQLATLDLTFHQAISLVSGNDIANEIISHILPAFIEGNKAVLYLSHRAPAMVEEHCTILNAIEKNDAVAAEAAMRKHIQKVYQELISIRQKQQNR
jgi:GntR family transcriptional regulator, transcriptional repressor for pyruvate dehydrogenase complex